MEFDRQPFIRYVKQLNENVIKNVAIERQRVLANQSPWYVYDSTLAAYEESFRYILDMPFEERLRKRQAEKGKVFALDVMGTAKFSSIFPIDGEMAMTHIDFRKETEKASDKKQHREVADGSILAMKPWRDVKNFITKHDTTQYPGYDLITCRPIAAWGELFDVQRPDLAYQYDVVRILMQRSASLLSPHGGTLFMELPYFADYYPLRKMIKATPGMDSYNNQHPDNYIRIVRSGSTPVRIAKV